MSTPSELHLGLVLALTIRGLAVTSYADMRRVAQRAEALGFDSVWLCDHFLTLAPAAYAVDAGVGGRGRPAAGTEGSGRPATGAEASGRPAALSASDAGGAARLTVPLLECWTALTALARDTHRVRLGTSVLCASYRLPSVLAKMAATLDVISEGRLELGLGAGWFEQEYRAYGVPFPRIGARIAQLDEAVEIVRRMWTERHPTFSGKYFAIDGAVCDPLPVQRPHPPIWIGGEGDRVHRVAARAADGVNVRWWAPERVATRAAYLDAACREYGRPPAALARSVTLLLVPDREPGRARATAARFAAIPADGHVVGTPAQCVERLGAYVAAGVRHFLLTIPDVATSPGLDLAGSEVLPALRRRS